MLLCVAATVVEGELLSIKLCGLFELIATRLPLGKVVVYDAFCPHLGAHLATGGALVDECDRQVRQLRFDVMQLVTERIQCIKCPFHGWTFDLKDGACSKVPYTTGN